jgi:hypothetical protein
LVQQADDLSASPPAPALAFVPMRLRIALCISGQLRGYEAAHPSWSRLGLDRHEVTRFVHVWQDIGRNWQRIWGFLRRDPFLWDTFVRPNSIAFLRPRYPILMEAALLGMMRSNQRDLSELVLPLWTPAFPFATSKSPPATPTPAPPPATTGPAVTSTGTPPTSSPPSSPERHGSHTESDPFSARHASRAEAWSRRPRAEQHDHRQSPRNHTNRRYGWQLDRRLGRLGCVPN